MVRKSHRAKWGSQLQIISNANVAAEGPLSFCSSGAVSVPRAQAQKTSLSLLFLIICTLTELEYLLHTEALCANPSAETVQAKPIFFAFCRSFSWILLSCRCFSFLTTYLHWLFPLLYWTYTTHAALCDDSRFWLSSCDPEVLMCESCVTVRKWGCAAQGWPWGTDALVMSNVCLAPSPFIKELAGLDKEQEAHKLFLKLWNEVLVCSLPSHMLDLCSESPCSCSLSLYFSCVLSRHDIPSREGKAARKTKRKSWQRAIHFLVDSHWN